MKGRPRVLLLASLAATIVAGAGAFAGDGPLAELERSLHDLESTVRAIHETRLETVRETDRGRTAAGRLEAEARDLEREAAALEDELVPARAAVASLEKEHEAALARHARLESDRAALEKVLSTRSERRSAPAGVALVECVRALEARLEAARTCTVEKDGTVVLGSAGRLDAKSPAARALADQIGKRTPPVLVRVPLELGEDPKR